MTLLLGAVLVLFGAPVAFALRTGRCGLAAALAVAGALAMWLAWRLA